LRNSLRDRYAYDVLRRPYAAHAQRDQRDEKTPPADVARDGSVQETLDLANQNRPSAAATSRPSSTLDD
jgi:hypothetical protein